MAGLLEGLSRAVEGSPSAALAAAFAWGVLSVLLSPCHLASVPLIVGFMSGRADLTAARAFRVSLVFALGVLAAIGLAGALAAALGRLLGDVGGWANYLAAAIFLYFGLHLLAVVPLPLAGRRSSPAPRPGGAALAVGFVYGLALGPCTFAYMAPVLAVSFRAGASSPLLATSLIAAFGLGHCAVIAGAGASVGAAQRWLRWGEGSRALLVGRRVCGALVLLGGLYLVYTAP